MRTTKQGSRFPFVEQNTSGLFGKWHFAASDLTKVEMEFDWSL
jgi:hypothetical protein